MATRLEQIADQIGQRKQPPVDRWKPENVGTIDIKIDAQGFWFHEGGPINRIELVKLFASILWYEAGQHFLVTPVEKLAIEVEDVPYVIQQAEFIDGAWLVTTNTLEQVVLGDQHVVELRLYQGLWVPYVNIRYDLWARISRSIYYQWVSEAINQQQNENETLSLYSGDYEFEVARE